MTEQKQQLPPPVAISLTDRLISLGLLFVLNMGIAAILKICLNKAFVWFGLQALPYTVVLAMWFAWIIMFVLPLMLIGAFIIGEMSYTTSLQMKQNSDMLDKLLSKLNL